MVRQKKQGQFTILFKSRSELRRSTTRTHPATERPVFPGHAKRAAEDRDLFRSRRNKKLRNKKSSSNAMLPLSQFCGSTAERRLRSQSNTCFKYATRGQRRTCRLESTCMMLKRRTAWPGANAGKKSTTMKRGQMRKGVVFLRFFRTHPRKF